MNALADLILADVNHSIVITSESKITALQGMSGIGKSVLAAAFARTCQIRRIFYDGIIWLTIGRGQNNVIEQLQRVGESLGSNNTLLNGDIASAKWQISKILNNKSCLIILDDVWDGQYPELFREVLGSSCRLLITTRDGQVATSMGAQEYSVNVLNQEMAVKLLAEWIREPIVTLSSQAYEVAKECDNLPLALALCGALIRDGLSWNSLLEALREADLEYLDHPSGSLLKSLKISINALEQQYHCQLCSSNWFKSGMNHAETGNLLENLRQ